MPKAQSPVARLLKSPTLIAFAAVVGVVVAALFGFVVLTWLVFEERYGVGFIDYVQNFLL